VITVVIASYRYGHLASHCIESVLSQTTLPERILFVDDGVGDCAHLPSSYPTIEYVLRKHNLGIISNFQDMLMRVGSEYTLFLGADNWLRSDALEQLSKCDTDIVTYDIVVTGELKSEIQLRHADETTPYCGDIYWKREHKHHGSMMYRTAFGKQVGYKKYRDEVSQPEEDWYLWEEMLKLGATVSYIPEGLLYYRRHKENYLKYN
jgi:glycosyltransferase involved in cell wall biosynthesis